MKKGKSISIIFALFAVFIISSLSAHADLYNRGTDSLGNLLIYDSDLNITWYDYSNNPTTWWNQRAWAANLTVNFGGNIYDNWRLPTAVDVDWPPYGYNITSSEMGHLFYTELGNKGYYSTTGAYQPDYGLKNTGDFENLLSGGYWSGTAYSADTYLAWDFYTVDGSQVADPKDAPLYAIAVRTGDVPQQPIVPEPISSILFVTGGTLLAGRRLIKRKA